MNATDPRPEGSGIRPFRGESPVTDWRRRPWSDLASAVLTLGADGRPVLIAVDGRSGGGKTTAAQRLADEVPGAVVVHTDDVSWYESFFGWDSLLAAHVLLPLRQGRGVRYRPAAWEQRGREGAIEVPASAPLVIVEGVGSSRRSLTTLLDAAIWVQSDHEEATRRGIERDGGTDEVVAFWAEWCREEERFLDEDRPWERAWAMLCGTPALVAGGADGESGGESGGEVGGESGGEVGGEVGERFALVAGRPFGGGHSDEGPACRC
jgi:uridine kinase